MTNAIDLLKLAERCEATTADEQLSLLLEVGEFIFAEEPTKLRRFKEKLFVEAFESAAMTLVPEGVNYDLLGRNGYKSVAVIYGQHRKFVGAGEALALAICAAALRARTA